MTASGEQPAAPKKMGKGRGCLLVFLVLLALSFLGSLLDGGDDSPDTPHDRSTMAHIQCQEFVKARLKAPASADFPFLDRTVTDLGNNTYRATSYVDAQNSFGANLRTNYSCTVQYRGGDDAVTSNWTLVNLQMD